MPGLFVRAVVDTRRLEQIVDKMPEAAAMMAEAKAEVIRSRAEANAPRRTGALAGSIKKIAAGALRWIVVALVSYAAFVEWGTSRMAAQPYMRPALEASEDNDVIDKFMRALGL